MVDRLAHNGRLERTQLSQGDHLATGTGHVELLEIERPASERNRQLKMNWQGIDFPVLMKRGRVGASHRELNGPCDQFGIDAGQGGLFLVGHESEPGLLGLDGVVHVDHAALAFEPVLDLPGPTLQLRVRLIRLAVHLDRDG